MPPSTVKPGQGLKKPLNDAEVEVRHSPTPPLLSGANFSPIWLAYGSDCYLTNRPDNMVDALGYILDVRLAQAEGMIRLRGTWQMAQAAPYLLASYADFRQGTILSRDGAWVLDLISNSSKVRTAPFVVR